MTTKVGYCEKTTYLVLCFVKSLPWWFNINLLTDIKISFYRNIAILCAEMSRVNCVLSIEKFAKELKIKLENLQINFSRACPLMSYS